MVFIRIVAYMTTACLIFIVGMLGYSKFVANKPIVFKQVVAIYNGEPYSYYNSGHVKLGPEHIVYFESYKLSYHAIVVFKMDKCSPPFSIVYAYNIPKSKLGRCWVDKYCDGEFQVVSSHDDAFIPDCWKKPDS